MAILTKQRNSSKQRTRAKMKARNQAIKDLKELHYEFSFLRPCETTFDPLKGGWRKSRTSFRLITRSINAMYVMSLGNCKSVRVIELSTGDFYYLRTKQI